MASGPTIHSRQNRLKQPRAFCQTARTASFSPAAAQIGLGRPAVALQTQADRAMGPLLE
jgi:hypothetical protein